MSTLTKFKYQSRQLKHLLAPTPLLSWEKSWKQKAWTSSLFVDGCWWIYNKREVISKNSNFLINEASVSFWIERLYFENEQTISKRYKVLSYFSRFKSAFWTLFPKGLLSYSMKPPPSKNFMIFKRKILSPWWLEF